MGNGITVVTSEEVISHSLITRHAEAQVMVERLERLSREFAPVMGENNLGKLVRRAIYQARCLEQDLKFCLDLCLEKQPEAENSSERAGQVIPVAT